VGGNPARDIALKLFVNSLFEEKFQDNFFSHFFYVTTTPTSPSLKQTLQLML
jgi:hypothetical protein